MVMRLTLILLVLGLSACVFFDEEESCHIDVYESANQSGTFYKTVCTNHGRKYGLINEDFEPVISEVYDHIDDGLTLQVEDEEIIAFTEDIKYFRVLTSNDNEYKQQVIDRKGQVMMEVEAFYDVIISKDQEMVYSFYENGQIYHIEEERYETVDYRIIQSLNGYHIANLGDGQVVLDGHFQIIHEGNYEKVLYLSSEQFIYKKGSRIYSKNLVTNEEVSLFDTLDYPDYSLHEDWPTYVLINPNSLSKVFFINSKTGQQIDIEDCSRVVSHYQNTFTMRCDVGYKVFAKDSLETLLEVPRSNTYFVPEYPVFFTHTEEQTTIHSLGEVLTFDVPSLSHRVIQDDLLEVTTDEGFIYMSLETFEILYEVDQPCMFLVNSHSSDFLFHKGECVITRANESLRVLSLEDSILSESKLLEFQYYTEDLLFFVKDGHTVITDYDLHVLYE